MGGSVASASSLPTPLLRSLHTQHPRLHPQLHKVSVRLSRRLSRCVQAVSAGSEFVSPYYFKFKIACKELLPEPVTNLLLRNLFFLRCV